MNAFTWYNFFFWPIFSIISCLSIGHVAEQVWWKR